MPDGVWGNLSVNTPLVTRELVMWVEAIDSEVLVRVPEHLSFIELIKRLCGPIHFDTFLPRPFGIFRVWKVRFWKPEAADKDSRPSKVSPPSYTEGPTPIQFFCGIWLLSPLVMDCIRHLGVVNLLVTK